MISSLSIHSFMDHAFAVVSKKSSPNLRSSRFSPVLSSRSFIVLCFTFRLVIYFELFFVKGVWSVSMFIFLHVQFVTAPLLKRLSFLHCIAFVPSSKISWFYICEGLFLGSQFCSIDLFVCSFANTTHCLDN